ncbi:MAG: DUF4369 domain-containing protein [Bacteroidales bacterium]|nr:DUF4369 domain-containing protein [Bacteroidales bacterium]
MNMKISRKIFFVLFIFLAVSCKENKELKKDFFTLSGVVSNSTEQYLVLSEVGKSGFTQNDTIPIDEKGNFSKSIKMQEPTLYSLSYGKEYIIICPAIEEEIKIKAVANNFSGTYMVEGSKESELLKKLNKENYNVRLSLKSMSEELKKTDVEKLDSVRASMLEKYISTKQYQEKITKDFINENLGSLTTLIALHRTFDGIPLFDFRQDLEIHKRVLKALEQTFPNNQHTLTLKNFIAEKEKAQKENGIK